MTWTLLQSVAPPNAGALLSVYGGASMLPLLFVALWALAHIMIAPTGRTLVIGLTIGFLALVGAHMQDRKKAVLMGDGWAAWQARTHFWPRWRHLFRAGLVLWLIALVLWLVLTWAHIPTAYVPAGIWRWVG